MRVIPSAIGALLGLSLTFVACSDEGEPASQHEVTRAETAYQDVLSSFRAVEPEERPISGSVVSEWNLAEAAERSRLRTSGVVAEGGGLGLVLASQEGQPAHVDFPVEADATDINAVVLRLRVREVSGPIRSRLFWRRTGDIDFQDERSIEFTTQPDEVFHFSSRAVPIAGPLWDAHVEEIRIQPIIGDGRVEITHAVFGRLEGLVLGSPRALDSQRGRRGRAKVGELSLRGRRLSGPLKASIEVPHRSQLVLAIGTGRVAGSEASATFRLAVDGDSIFERVISPRQSGQWFWEVLDCTRWGGQQVELLIDAQGAAASQGAALVGFAKLLPREPRTAAPNVLMISLDTLRADHLSLYGYHRETSPILDAIADESFVFERAYAQAPVTLSSHVSLFTGLYTSGSNAYGHRRIAPGTTTLAEVLRLAGWTTLSLTDGGYMAEEFGVAEGFEVFSDSGGGADPVFSRGPELLNQVETRPWLLFLHTYEIHSPYDAPEAFRRPITDEWQTLPSSLSADELYQMAVDEETPSSREWQQVIDLYDAGIRYTDDCLGRLMQKLRERGDWEDTVLVIVSDHGEELGERGATGHGHTLYEEMIRVPLIVRIPEKWRQRWSLAPPARVSKPVELVDVLPTLLDLLQVEPLAWPSHDGESLVPLLKDRPYETSPAISGFQPGGHRGYSVISPRWKLFHFEEKEGLRTDIVVQPDGTYLFDLMEDPAEKRSLDNPMRAKLEGYFRARRDAWRLRASESPVGLPPDQLLSPERIEDLKRLGYLRGR